MARRRDSKSRRWSRGYRAGKRVAYNSLVKTKFLAERGQPGSIDFFGKDRASANDVQKYHRRALGFYGPGAYFSANPTVAAGLRAGGAWLGRLTGIPGAAEVGRWGAGQASKWLGFGAYSQPTSGNQLMVDSSQVPITVNSSSDETGDVYISHREFVMNVTATATAAGATPFQQQQIALNPGLSTSFPFLSQLAQNFEMYDFNGLMFQYVPTSGESGASSNSLGKVLMATNYDPDAAPFLNSVQMENYDYACSTKPSLGLIHGVETHNGQQVVNMMYVRTGAGNKDKAFTDIGTFTIATEGVPAAAAGTQIIGELWVTYSIKLSRANLYNSLLGLGIPTDWWLFGPSTTNLGNNITFSSKNTNVWLVESSPTAPATRIRLRCNQLLSLGCFQVSMYLYSPTNVNTVQWGNPVYVQNSASITNVGGAFTLFANKTAAEPSAASITFFKVNQSSPGLPAIVELVITAAVPDNTFYGRIMVSQISCAMDGEIV